MAILERILRRRRVAAPPVIPDDFGLPEPVRLPDPAEAAAALLLSEALMVAGETFASAGCDGSVVMITVPDVTWVKPVLAAWRQAAREGDKPEDGYRTRFRDEGWVSWSPKEAPRKLELEESAATFEQAVATGRHCAAVTADPAWVPGDLVKCADLRLPITLLTGSDVIALVETICGGSPTIRLDDVDASALTPRILRLACRPGQTADSYVGKLKELLAREAETSPKPKKTSESVREAPTLRRLHGMDAAVQWGLSLAQDLERYKVGKIRWDDVDRGLLVSGPPGVGKSLYARALAATCGVALVTGSYSDWHGTGSGHQGDLLKAMRRTFETAREQAPAILFIDEIDSFPHRASLRHAWSDWEIQVVNALLSELDGAKDRDGVVVIGACNMPYKLDPALTRAGRLDRHVRIELPNIRALTSIFREHLAENCPDDQDLGPVAVAAVGSTGADVELFVRGARRRARNENRPVALNDVMLEIVGLDSRTPADLWAASVHEAGHAVACVDLAPGRLEAISLRRSGSSAGFTAISPGSGWRSAAELKLHLKLTLAGRAAEEVLLGAATSGAGGGAKSDLAAATRLAASAAASIGFDPHIGLMWLGEADSANLPGMLRDFPLVYERAKENIEAAYLETLDLIRRRVGAVSAVATALIRRRALEGGEVERIVRDHADLDGGSAR